MLKAAPQSEIVDQFGTPFRNERQKLQASLRKLHQQRLSQIRASYDAARNTPTHERHWANADRYDADSSNNPQVRGTLVSRSRYEIANNGWSSGVAKTYATDLVGKGGPKLLMMSGSKAFNQMVERRWLRWCKKVKLRRKLWCMVHAKHSDGEALGVIRPNRALRNTVPIDVRLYETEHCATPSLLPGTPGYVDGIRFDEFDNPIWYDILREHPGGSGHQFDLVPERVPANLVLHWFRLIRPGQHRGIPESTSTLNVGAAGRRMREATVNATEIAANFSVLVETEYEPDGEDPVEPMEAWDIDKGMMVALPNLAKAKQLKAEHPVMNYGEFNDSLIAEQARPICMPFNLAAGNNKNQNFAGGKLDHLPYHAALDTEREDCNDVVLDPLFDVWFDAAVITYGWLGGDPEAISEDAKEHEWRWPGHRVADEKSKAQTNKLNLETGVESLADIYMSDGRDYEDELEKQAENNGITVEEQRMENFLRNRPQHYQQVSEADDES